MERRVSWHLSRRSRKSAERGERRGAPRYAPSTEFARVGWWGDEEFHHAAALLLNVSQTGILVLADELPPEDPPVFVCLGGPEPSGWIEAEVVEVVRTECGPHRVHLAFCGPCPYEFFKAAVYGMSAFLEAALAP